MLLVAAIALVVGFLLFFYSKKTVQINVGDEVAVNDPENIYYSTIGEVVAYDHATQLYSIQLSTTKETVSFSRNQLRLIIPL